MKVKISAREIRDYPSEVRVKEVAKDLGLRAVAAQVDGQIVDLDHRLEEGDGVRILTFEDPEGKKVFWHSTSHIMAQAVRELFPEVKLGIGPPISQGFYYDFRRRAPFSEEELGQIEKRMQEIVKANLPFQREEVSKEEALMVFRGEDFKIQLIQEIEDERVTLYRQGGYVDLCRGPHLPFTGMVKAFKLLSVAGAYWKGDEKGPVMQRIYGISFPEQGDLERYLKNLEEAKRRDHRRLGRELDLFSIHEEAGAGLVYWHPKGAVIRNIIEDFWKAEHIKRGYQLVYIPHIAKAHLWRTSGHYDFYRENMYFLPVEGEEYVLKPMNCPGHIIIYKSRKRSYRDLPIRYAELGTVYRAERSGVLHGMLRVRGFTQDDAHIFCRLDQLEEEILGVIDLAQFMLQTFGYQDYQIDLSVRDPQHKEKYAGSDQDWQRAEESLVSALQKRGLDYRRAEGEAVFYGPKIDIKLLDALGRTWQGSTIQFDFNLPQRFNITYTDRDNSEKKVIMIHRALLGAMERFIGGLIEFYGGAFPLWLAPVQVVIMPITDSERDYGELIRKRLFEEGIRVELDDRNEKIGHKIREAELQKVPYMLILGKRETQGGTVAVRQRRKGDLGQLVLDSFCERLKEEIEQKQIW